MRKCDVVHGTVNSTHSTRRTSSNNERGYGVKLGNIPIIPAKRKKGYAPHGSKGKYTEEEMVARRERLAMRRHEKFFDFRGETYVRRGDAFVPWWK